MTRRSQKQAKLVEVVQAVAVARVYGQKQSIGQKYAAMFEARGGFDLWISTDPGMADVYNEALEAAKRSRTESARKSMLAQERQQAARLRHLQACLEAASAGTLDARKPICISRVAFEIQKAGGNGAWIRANPALYDIFRSKLGSLADALLSKRIVHDGGSHSKTKRRGAFKPVHGTSRRRGKAVKGKKAIVGRGASEASSVGMTEGSPWSPPPPYCGPSQKAEPLTETSSVPQKIDWNRSDENGL